MDQNENEITQPTGGDTPLGTLAEDLENSSTPDESGEESSKEESQEAEVEEAGDNSVDEVKPKKDRVQERIDEITGKRREAEREAAYWRGRAEAAAPKEAVTPAQPIPDPMAPFNVPRPKEDDFETYGEYEAQKDEWLVSKAKHEARQETAREINQRQANEATDKTRQSAVKWLREAPSNLPDFADVVTKPPSHGGPAISPEMAEICRNSPVGHQMLYDIARDSQDAWNLYTMPPHLMAAELTRREAKLTIAPASPKKISGAPEPIKPLSPGSTTISKPLEDLSEAEYIQVMNRKEYGPNWKG